MAKRPTTSVCVSCQREYPIDKFYPRIVDDKFSPDGVIPYCADCCEEIVRENLTKVNSLESAMWLTCAKLDVPFIRKVFEKVEEQKSKYQQKSGKKDSEYTLFKYYYDYLWGSKSMGTAIDVWIDFSNTDVSMGEISSLKKSEEALNREIEKLELDWGIQKDIEDYRFLVYNFDKYTKDVGEMTPQQEDLYRDLCLARLEKRKIEEKKLDGDLTKVQNRILNIMHKLNLDVFEDNQPKTLSDKMIFSKIAMIEEHEPADFYKDKDRWRDTTHRRKYYRDNVLRPTLNTLANMRDFNIDIEDVKKYMLDKDGN